MVQPGHGPDPPRVRPGALRRRASGRRAHRAARAGRGRGRGRCHRVRAVAAARRSDGRPDQRGPAVPGGGDQPGVRVRPTRRRWDRCAGRLRGRGPPAPGQPAGGRLPAGGAVVRSGVGRRAPAHVVLDAEPPRRPRRVGDALRRRRRRGGGGRARRGGRVRRQDRPPSGGPAVAVAGPPLRPARPLARDPQREPAGDGAGARPGARRGHGRPAGRHDRGVPAVDRPGRGRLPGDGRLPADDDPVDGCRHLRHPGRRGGRAGGRHHHAADRRLSGGGPPGGHRRHRACGRPVRGRGGHGPGRGAPAQPAAPVRRAAHHAHGGDV